jgi:hypothetical protein
VNIKKFGQQVDEMMLNVKGTEPMGKVTTAGCGQLWLQLKNLECTSNKRLLHYTLKSFFYLYL